MPRNITITFDDGTSHVYQNAPDDITPDAVEERATKEFEGKKITKLDGGRSAGGDQGRGKVNPKPAGPNMADRFATEFANRGSNDDTLAKDLKATLPTETLGGLLKGVKSPLDASKQVGEGIATSALGAGASVLGGLAGAARTGAGQLGRGITAVLGGSPGESFDESASAGADVVKKVQSWAPEPKSEIGKYTQKLAGLPLEGAKAITKNVGAAAGRVLGNEAAGETIGEALLDAAAALSMKKKPEARGIAELPQKQKAQAYIIDKGYSMTPNTTPSKINKTLTTVGKKEVINENITLDNQENTDKIAKRAVGLREDQPLDEAAFINKRAEHGKVYEAIKKLRFSIRVDQPLLDRVNALSKSTLDIQRSFPEWKGNDAISRAQNLVTKSAGIIEPAATIELIKSLREDSRFDLKRKEISSKEKNAAMSMIKIADALEDHLDRGVKEYARITPGGKGVSPTLVQDMRNARREIAKLHDLQSATNLDTGNVNATAVKALRDKGKPLTGGLKTIAIAAKVAPDVVKKTDGKVRPSQFSLGDIGMASVGGLLTAAATHGATLPAVVGAGAAAAARPIAGATATSRWYQNKMVKPKGKNTTKGPVGRAAPAFVLGAEEQDSK